MKQFSTTFNANVVEGNLQETKKIYPVPIPGFEDIDKMPPYQKSDEFEIDQELIKDVMVEKFKYLNATDEGIKRAIWFHGGGFIVPLVDVYRYAAEFYCKMLNITELYFFDYRIAPEHKYPAAHEDAYNVYVELANRIKAEGNDFIAIGDSAGGNLLFCTMQRAVKEGLPLPYKMLALSPWMELGMAMPSHYYNAQRDALLGTNDLNNPTGAIAQLTQSDYIAESDRKKPEVEPIYGDFKGLPPTFISAGQYELLLSDALGAMEAMTASGCDATLFVEGNMFHDYTLIPMLPQSPKALNLMKDFLTK